MALDAELEIGRVHADAVVADPDQIAPARLDGDLDPPRPGVERVLDQLLHRRGGPLDHFAGGDAVDEQRRTVMRGFYSCSAKGEADAKRGLRVSRRLSPRGRHGPRLGVSPQSQLPLFDFSAITYGNRKPLTMLAQGKFPKVLNYDEL